MSSKYTINDPEGLYFITTAVVEWVDVFTRVHYKDIFVESLKYCQKEKGLIIYAWVLMTNHYHMIVRADKGKNLSDILRDLKRHTSNELIKAINDPKESRRKWMLWLFKSAGLKNSNNKNYQFWQQDNRPIELSSNDMMDQRLAYIHDNPVKAGIVRCPEDYIYSSAINYSGKKGLIDVEFIG
jgi:putative transposase